jgi:SsrA-binding protein
MAKKKPVDDGFIAENRKARFQYEVLETLECGVVLQGSEVKSLRAKQVSFSDAFAQVEAGELFLWNLKIDRYRQSNIDVPETTRKRRLLVSKKEIERFHRLVREKGLTLVPLRLYFKGPWAKVLVGVAKGKTFEDKRETIKRREADRDMRRHLS